MPNFAHIETEQAQDLQPGDTTAAYLKRFPGVDTSKWDVAQLFDGVQPGAKLSAGTWYNPDGSIVAKDGTFTPGPVKPTPAPQVTTKQQILDQIAVLQGLANQLP